MTTLRNWLLAAAILAAMSLSVGCGQETPPDPQTNAYPLETCTVVFFSDGTIQKRDCLPWQTADAALPEEK